MPYDGCAARLYGAHAPESEPVIVSAVTDRLPTFPWDKLEPYKKTAAAHPGGIVDLSVGTPVDPVPDLIQKALIAAADSPGYPTVWGTPALRDAITGWVERRLGAREVTHRHVLPIVGSKELVAWLPTHLGLGPGDRVAYPRLAYPTYEVGARLARAEYETYDDPTQLNPEGLKLLWLNSPSNPTGKVLPKDELTRIVAWAREHGILVFSDECYLELGWDADPVSVLHPDVNGGSYDGIVAVHSLSKRSNLAGYRAAFLMRRPGGPRPAPGDPQARRHDDLVPDPGSGDRGPRRRHPRPGTARALPDPPHRPARGPRRPRLPHRTQRGQPVLVGNEGRVLLEDGRPPGRPGHPGGTGRLLRRGGRTLRTSGPDGDG